MLKKLAISLFLSIYVFVSAAIPVLGGDIQTESVAASADNEQLIMNDEESGVSNQTEESSGTEQPAAAADDNTASKNEPDDYVSNPAENSDSGISEVADQKEKPASSELTEDADSNDSAQNEAEETANEDGNKEEAAPFSAHGTSAAGVYVKASAKAGVLPAGTTMHLYDVSASRAESAAGKVLDEEVCSAQGVDISFRNAAGKEIEPDGNVQVSIRLADALEGRDFTLIHVADSGASETLGGATSTGANFASDEFSLYVLAGTGTEQDPYSNVYREYTIGFGESVTIMSDERNADGTWIPGAGNPAWTVTDISGGNVDQLATFNRYRGTADVQPRLIVTAKNKTGTIRVAFRYTHPEDRTHKTVTGEFIATHYYLIHVVNKSKNTYSVQFRNNDGTGISHVEAEDLVYTTEDGVTAERTVNANYLHTFTISEEDPSTRRGKVTLIMPEYPGSTTRTSGGKSYKFIGWSISASANSTDTSAGLTPIVYPNPDAHVFAPGDKFPLDRDVTLWAVWSLQNNMKATFHIRIDDHIPNEPQSHGNASYTQIGSDVTYTIPSAEFKTDAVNGVGQEWDPSKRQKPWPAKVFFDLKNAGKLPDDVTSAEEFNKRYRIVWSTIKRENEGWHVDGVLYERELFNLAYHENGDLVVVSSMPEGVKNIPEGETTPIDTKIPNRYDMVFTGWNTKADGNGTPYIPGSSVVVSEHPELDTSIKTLHLYAQWVKATRYIYTVRYLEAGTNKVLKAPVSYGDQILGNKILSKDESDKATSDIEDYVFSYAEPAIGDGSGGIEIGDDNSKNVITLFYMPREQGILATELNVNKTDSKGAPLKGAEFELTKTDSTEATTFTSDAEGVVNIPFTDDPGPEDGDVLTYTLKESKAPEGYEKSDDEFTITIKRGEPRVVTFPGGISKTMFPLVATVLRNGEEVDAGSITVVNNKIPDPIALPIRATKVLEGRELKEGEFDFALTDAEGEQVSEASNAADGSIEFKDIIVDQTGTYEYTIREIAGDDEEIEYDESSYNVTAKVVLNEDNILEVESISYEKDGEPAESAVFTNKYTSEPDVPEDMLTIIYDLNGGVYNDDESDIVEHYYYGTKISIHEAPTREGYRFLYWKGSSYQPGDEYTVVEDHKFVAQWEPIENKPEGTPTKTPPTGDANNMISLIILMILSGAGLIFTVLRQRIHDADK